MIDTHAHLDFENFEKDREEVILRAFHSGVKKIVNIGVDLDTSRRSIELAEKFEEIFASVGFHPEHFTRHETQITKHDWIEELKKLASNKKVVAIGEIGLDYFHITHSRHYEKQELEEIKKRQRSGFLDQIEVAKALGLPVVVHCREAWEDLYKIISNFIRRGGQISNQFQNPNDKILKNKKIPSKGEARQGRQDTRYKMLYTKFVLHCYSGSEKDTEKFLNFPGVYFSFSGNITYPKPFDRAENFREVIGMIPLDRMMLDSDSPFLAPQEFRGKRNEPAYIRYISKKIAEIKQISEEEVEQATDKNARNFFGIECG